MRRGHQTSVLRGIELRKSVSVASLTPADGTTTLPLIVRGYGRTRWQLCTKTRPIRRARGGLQCRITISGNNPSVIQVGAAYDDFGATVRDTGMGQAGDTNLGIKTFLNGTLVSTIVIDTSEVRHRHDRPLQSILIARGET